MKITITYFENDAGAKAVLATERRMREILLTAEDRALEAPAEDAALIRAAASKARSEWDEARQHPDAKQQTFEIEPYTFGDRLSAERKATRWVEGHPRMDQSVYTMELVKAATGWKEEDLEGLAPQVGAVLISEVMALCEPDVGKLDFLRSQPLGSEITVN